MFFINRGETRKRNIESKLKNFNRAVRVCSKRGASAERSTRKFKPFFLRTFFDYERRRKLNNYLCRNLIYAAFIGSQIRSWNVAQLIQAKYSGRLQTPLRIQFHEQINIYWRMN
jgi:hypothetical protein